MGQIETMEARHQKLVNDSRLALEQAAQPLLDRKALLEHQIKEFAEANKADLGNRKSRPLNFGLVGFRQSTSIVVRSVKNVIAALKARGMQDCIAVKERVDKEALKKYPDEVLREIGAQRKVEDAFFYEVNRDALQRTS